MNSSSQDQSPSITGGQGNPTLATRERPRRLVVRLELLVADLPMDERLDLAASTAFDDETPEQAEAELPRVHDISAYEVARVLETLSHEWAQDELWGGSEVYAQFTGVRVINAVWDGEGGVPSSTTEHSRDPGMNK